MEVTLVLTDYRLISYQNPLKIGNNEATPRTSPITSKGGYLFKNTVRLISINSAVVEKYLGIHNLSDYKLRKVKQSLETIIPVDLEALFYKEVPAECISL
jgi:hypothetical protein